MTVYTTIGMHQSKCLQVSTESNSGLSFLRIFETMAIATFAIFSRKHLNSCIEFTTSANFANGCISGSKMSTNRLSCRAQIVTSNWLPCSEFVSDLSLAQAGDCLLTLIKADKTGKNADFKLGLIFSSRLLTADR